MAVYGNEYHRNQCIFIFRVLIGFELIPQFPVSKIPNIFIFCLARADRLFLIKVILCAPVVPSSCHTQPGLPLGPAHGLSADSPCYEPVDMSAPRWHIIHIL